MNNDKESVSGFSIASSDYITVDSRSNEPPAFRPPSIATHATERSTSPSVKNDLVKNKTSLAERRTPCLRLTLPAIDGITQSRHAIVPFPSSYIDTVDLAIEIFREYSKQLNHDNIRLRYKDCIREGNWVWADVLPSTWNLIVQPDDEVGVFFKQTPLPEVSEWTFVNGKINITYGQLRGGEVDWSFVHSCDSIDRPRSFEEAKKAITILSQRPNISMGLPREGEEEFLKHKFRFFRFTSMRGDKYTTDYWVEFPPMAYQDDNVWRAFVPEPGMILGFMLEQ